MFGTLLPNKLLLHQWNVDGCSYFLHIGIIHSSLYLQEQDVVQSSRLLWQLRSYRAEIRPLFLRSEIPSPLAVCFLIKHGT